MKKWLEANYWGKNYLEQFSKITIKSVFKKLEMQLREELLKAELEGIEIVYTKANYGWYRTWFKCPVCEIKVFTLYDINWEFKCRKCSWLQYKKQRYKGMIEGSI